MDIGLDTIVYIVLGLIFVIAQVAKKKKAAEGLEGAGNEENELETSRRPPSIFEELLGFKEPDTVVTEPSINKEPPIDDISPLFSSNNSQYEEDTDVLLNSEMIKTDDDQKGKEQFEVETLHAEGFDFDLRDAVIYSAILEPKYF